MQKIKVLHFELTENMGGIESFLYNLYSHIDREKVQFDFVTTVSNPALQNKFLEIGGQIHKVAPYKQIFKYISDIRHLLQNNYDVVHIHKNSAANILPVILAKECASRIIVHSHNTAPVIGKFAYPFHYINRGYLSRMNNKKLACSKVAGQWLFGKKTVANDQVNIINNGIDAEQFRYNVSLREAYRQQLKLDGKLVIGHVGRFSYQKNHDFLIDIFHEIHNGHSESVLMLGGDGELKEEIKAKVDHLRITDSVLFLGMRTDIPELLQAMDVFVLPSHFEGLPVVAIEAQAAGLRMFMSDAVTAEAKITDLVEYLSLEQGSEYWAEKILQYKDNYPHRDTYKEIIAAGFDIKETAQWLENFYLEQGGKFNA